MHSVSPDRPSVNSMLVFVCTHCVRVCVCVCVCVCVRLCYCRTWYCFHEVRLRHLRDSPALWLDLYSPSSVLRITLISAWRWETTASLCLFTSAQSSVGCANEVSANSLGQPSVREAGWGGGGGGSLSMPALYCIQNAISGERKHGGVIYHSRRFVLIPVDPAMYFLSFER